jgi:hypothetical protein
MMRTETAAEMTMSRSHSPNPPPLDGSGRPGMAAPGGATGLSEGASIVAFCSEVVGSGGNISV